MEIVPQQYPHAKNGHPLAVANKLSPGTSPIQGEPTMKRIFAVVLLPMLFSATLTKDANHKNGERRRVNL
jgi:hypothetical protein